MKARSPLRRPPTWSPAARARASSFSASLLASGHTAGDSASSSLALVATSPAFASAELSAPSSSQSRPEQPRPKLCAEVQTQEAASAV